MRSAAHGAGWRRGRSYESSGRIPVPRPPEPTPESLAGVEGAGARDRGAPRPPSVTASDLAGSVRYAVGAAGAVALVLGVLQTQGAHALRERQCGRLVSLSWWAGTSGAGGGMVESSFRLGRIAGVEVGVNWSWLVVFVLIAWSLAVGVF